MFSSHLVVVGRVGPPPFVLERRKVRERAPRIINMKLASCWYAVLMPNIPKRKATFYISEDVLRAAKVSAARTDRRDSEVVERALREYLGFDVLDRVWARSELSEKEALDLAVAEVHTSRRRKHASRRP